MFFEFMFTLPFVLFCVVFVLILVKGIGQWNKNNNSPRLTVDAAIVAKRQHTSHHHHGTDMHMHHHSSSYYVTFQVESGDRMELHVAGHEFGMLIEGDKGMLTFQGTRYLGFERKLDAYTSERYQDQ
jgi:hypothetical protein